jgi:hypothetical protein
LAPPPSCSAITLAHQLDEVSVAVLPPRAARRPNYTAQRTPE